MNEERRFHRELKQKEAHESGSKVEVYLMIGWSDSAQLLLGTARHFRLRSHRLRYPPIGGRYTSRHRT